MLKYLLWWKKFKDIFIQIQTSKCIRVWRCNTHLTMYIIMYIFYLQVMYGYYHETFTNMMKFRPCFIKIKIRLISDHLLQKQILNCSRNINNFYSKDWNSTNSNIIPHVFSISWINKRGKTPYFLFNKEKESTKKNLT